MESDVLNRIERIIGEENLSTEVTDLQAHGFDTSIHRDSPEVVVRPASEEEVSEIVKLANELEIPIIPRGAGTGLCGSVLPLERAILLDIARMNKIKAVRVEDLNCRVEAGVVYDELNKVLSSHGFFFPPTPESEEICTVGGMVASNASGMRAIKYGATRDYVLGLKAVLANGDIIEVGTNTLKNSPGYQLERLLVGSEGTLGIITEVVLRISPKPRKAAMAVAAFDDIRKAGACVSTIIAHSLIPSAIGFMDSTCIRAVNRTMNVDFPNCGGLCLIEVDGDPRTVENEVKELHEICQEVGAVSVEFSTDSKQMATWISGRKKIFPALNRSAEGVSVSLADDMAVPISKIPDAVVAFQEIAQRNGLLVGTYGHAADGNLHIRMLLDAEDPNSWEVGERAMDEIFDMCIELGGTVIGENGGGASNPLWTQKERASALNAMQAIKRALDPKNILNPGKLQQWDGSIVSRLRYPCKDFQD